MASMSLDTILAELKQVATSETKTAAAEEKTEQPGKVAAAKADLVDALKRAETATATKTASEKPGQTPADELQKVAADLAAADQEALVKEAQFYGAAVADGFMARLQQYEQSTSHIPATKTAAATDVEKIATEAIRGYVETQEKIKLAATQEYQRGYNDTLAEVEKIASDVFTQGAQDCAQVLQSLAQQ